MVFCVQSRLSVGIQIKKLGRGFNIPGSKSRVLINLYADDTTVYLSESDRYDTLQSILTTWCRASGAKFNLSKTEIIPLGTLDHRNKVVQSRKVHPEDQPLVDGIRIAEDGHPTRCLGAWIGNKVNAAQPWSPILDKIKATLDRWNASHPTLDAKRLIIQMTVGGMTQFLTKAQGMPTNVEKSLTKLIREFLWDGSTTPPNMSLKQLQQPRKRGGIDPLDIAARNEAINLTWLKAYLDLSPHRPPWTFAVDAIINCIQKKGITNPTDINTFLTTLRPTRVFRANHKQTPHLVISLLKTAKKFNLTFAPHKLSKRLKCQLPAWYHIGAPPQLYHRNKTQCLRQTHRATTVKNLQKISKRVTRHTTRHRPIPDCTCRHCRADRNAGCNNPHKCASLARDIVGNLDPKYNPYDRPTRDKLPLTHHRKEKNQRAVIKNGDGVIFDPSLTAKKSLDECFRIFGNPDAPISDPAYRLQNPRIGEGPAEAPTQVYTDGSCKNNGKQNAACGAGVWFGINHPKNKAIKVPGTTQSNQAGEIAAIVVALQSVSPLNPLEIISDSRYVIDGLTKHLTSWEDTGWIGIQNQRLFQTAAYHLRRRAAPTTFKWTKGHNQNEGNEGADELANDGANKLHDDGIDQTIPDTFLLQGARLAKITQALAYRYIIDSLTHQYNRQALMNLDIARHAIANAYGNLETDAAIWHKTRHPDIRKPIQNFLFRAIHGSLRIGDYWNKIPNYEIRATCPQCRYPDESLEHILTDCPSIEAQTIWGILQRTWPTTLGGWKKPTLGEILGCGCISPRNTHPDPPSKIAKGAARLKIILLSESAHLIWILRCDRVINGVRHSKTTTESRWLNKINARLDMDRRMAASPHYPLTVPRVKQTWQNLLSRSQTLPDDWATRPEVLVGITLPRPSVATEDT